MTHHRLIAGPFSALEQRLFGDIEALQRDDPLARVEVVVPSNLLGLDLRRRLAERIASGGARAGHGNVRFLTFLDLARQLAGEVPGAPAPPALLFATTVAAISAVPDARAFGDVRQRIGFARAVEATVRDLRDAGVPPDELARFAAGMRGDRARPLASLSALYAEVTRRLASHADEVATFAAAAGAARRRPVDEPLLVYGFYDLVGSQRRLLEALAESRPLFLFVPDYADDLGVFGRERTRAFYERLAGGSPELLAETANGGTRARWWRRFAARETGDALPDDGSLRLVEAADDTDETREVAREVLIGVEQGLSLARTAVLLRQESEAERFEAQLLRAGIPCFRRPAPSWGQSPMGRALALWLRLEGEGFRRDDVLEVLELLDATRPDPHAAQYRALVRQAGVVRGRESWDAAVARLAAARPAGEVDATEEAISPARRPEGAAAARELDRRWKALRDSAAGWPEEPLDWAGWAVEARRRLALLLAPGEIPPEAGAALDAVDALDGGTVSREAFFEVFASGLSARTPPSGRLGRDGVAILTVLEARGLAFDHVLVPGLYEKSFPMRGRPDPLLFDEERDALGRRFPLAPKVLQRPDEERFLFAVCADAARRRLTLLCSRRDTALDRERTVSQFFTRAAEALGPGRVRTTSLGVPTPDGPPIGQAEARRRVLHGAGAPTVAAVFSPLARALDRRAALDRPQWTEYEGRIADRELQTILAAHAPGRSGPISASALEMFCRCPYQYFFRRVLRLSPWEEADEPSDLHPLAQGTIFHDAARRVATARRGRPFAELSDSAMRRLASAAAVESMAAYEEREGTAIAPALLRELALERVGAYLEAWLRFEKSRGGDFAPAGAEVRFGPPDARQSEANDPALSTDACAEAAIPGGPVLLRGRIDLLSHSPAAERQRVTDFKVKASAEGVKTALDARGRGAIVFSGEMLQLPVYALAAAGPVRERSNLSAALESEYLFVAPHPDAREIAGHVTPIHLTADETGEAVERLHAVLGTVVAAVAEGVFRPRTTGIVRKEPCSVCDFDAICGPGHQSRYERKENDADPAVRRLAKLGEIS